ncbi:MAG: hypothetical protein V1790_13585 [Planctomycetota bacterium]
MDSPVVERHRPTLDESVAARLRALAARLRGYVLVEGIAWVIGFLFVAAVIQFALDYGTRGLRWSMRASLSALIVAGAAWILWRHVISPLRVRVGLAEAANLIERRFPDLSSLLVSAVRFSLGDVGSPETNSPTLVASVVSSVGPRVRSLDFSAVLDPRRARRSAFGVGGALLVALVAALVMPEVTRLWFARNVLLQNVEWPRRTHLSVDLPHGELVGARGDDVTVQAYAEGVQPREVEIVFTTASGQRGRETMVTVGSEGAYRFRYTFKNAQEDFVFRLEGGDDETPTYPARLLERPRVTWSQLRLVPPAYARLEAFTLGDGERAAQVLPGSDVTFTIAANKPIAQAVLMAGNKTVAPAVSDGERHVVTISPKGTQTYHFSLVDEFGLEDKQPVRFALRVVKDEPPRVRMKLPGVGEMVTPEAVLPIELEFADTYGLASAELVFQATRDGARDQGGSVLREGSIPLPTFRPQLTTFSTSLTWSVSSEAVTPGDRLTLFARAADFDDVSGPNSAESPPIAIRVVTRDELLAELARREQEFRMDFERLIDSQEQLRGRLLTLIGLSRSEAGSEEFSTTVATLERRQRSIAGSVNVVRQQVEQVLTEHRINQLATQTVEERLGLGIAEPLGRLTTRDLPDAADTIRRWSRDPQGEVGLTVDPQQVALLSQMRAILANMLQWEGYQEAVNMLRDILRLQNELRTETKDAVQQQGSKVFDDTPKN